MSESELYRVMSFCLHPPLKQQHKFRAMLGHQHFSLLTDCEVTTIGFSLLWALSRAKQNSKMSLGEIKAAG